MNFKNIQKYFNEIKELLNSSKTINEFKRKFDFFLDKKNLYKEIDLLINRFNRKSSTIKSKTLFNYLNFSHSTRSKDKRNIPSENNLICITNVTMGILDILSIIQILEETRTNIKIVTNSKIISEALKKINIDSVYWSYSKKEEILKEIDTIFNRNTNLTLLIIPLFLNQSLYSKYWGLKLNKLRKNKNDTSIFQILSRYNVPTLPFLITKQKKPLFYLRWLIFYQFYLKEIYIRELILRKNDQIKVYIGELILSQSLSSFSYKYMAVLLKKHLMSISRNKKNYFKTQNAIISPIATEKLLKEINQSEILTKTSNNHCILLLNYKNIPHLINEIGRLRELTFRSIGEGTGKSKDIDKYDRIYKHMIIWNSQKKEVIGAYRMGIGPDIMNSYNHTHFYTNSLFNFKEEFYTYLPFSIECGRSFIQKKYWNTMALEYMWYGIGSYLLKNPRIKYLFGPVSISHYYSNDAKDMIVYFYQKWYSPKKILVTPKNPYIIEKSKLLNYKNIFNASIIQEDFMQLKKQLKFLGYTIPILYKQYTELCNYGSVHFHAFSTDHHFNHCLDGFIFLEIAKIKESKIKRYQHHNDKAN